MYVDMLYIKQILDKIHKHELEQGLRPVPNALTTELQRDAFAISLRQ